MEYADAVAYLLGRVNYEVRGMPTAETLRLDRIGRLLQLLGNPHLRYRTVHIAGTKGKGSTATLLATMLSNAGVRTGLHTSPHLERIEERMTVDGKPPTPAEFAALVREVVPHVAALDADRPEEQPELTFFEVTTAMTLLHFHERRVDWAVVEVGMGGRLDATNVVRPEVAVVTRIGIDHTKTLGDTIAQIAAEKAGILKPGVPVVSAALHPDAQQVVRETAALRGCELFELGRDYRFEFVPAGLAGGDVVVETWRKSRRFRLRMLGDRQAENAATAIAVGDLLVERCGLPDLDVAALADLRIPCRIEVLSERPLVILDAAHNEASAQALADALAALPSVTGPRILIFAATQDKDWPTMLRILAPHFTHVVCTQYRHNARAVPTIRLLRFFSSTELKVAEAPDPASAWKKARELVSRVSDPKSGAPCGIVCACGSFFLASELRPTMTADLA